jgi:hypothetical protein
MQSQRDAPVEANGHGRSIPPAAERCVEAYVDEAGAKGRLRNLDSSTDDKIAVLAGIAVPEDERDRFRAPLTPPFEKFKAARPTGETGLHITDAFASGDQAILKRAYAIWEREGRPHGDDWFRAEAEIQHWADVARESRAEIFAIIKKLEIPVIYDARRLRVARENFAKQASLIDQLAQQVSRTSRLMFDPATNASKRRV